MSGIKIFQQSNKGVPFPVESTHRCRFGFGRMRPHAKILSLVVVLGLVQRSVGLELTPVAANDSKQGSTTLLCNETRVICVPQSVVHSLISNPFRIEVKVNSPDEIEVDWKIVDSTGEVLESSSTYDYPDMPTRDSSPAKILRIQDFIFKPARSERGTLFLRPSRYAITTGKVDLPGIEIPVRLTTKTSIVTTLEPADPQELGNAVNEAMDSSDFSAFDPKLKLVQRHVTVMRVNRDAIIGVTAEAVLRADPGQGPWHVTSWHQVGDTAHVRIAGDGWAGVSYYLTSVSYLIRKSVLNLPGVNHFVFDPR